jgi:DUF1009 family protein
MGLEDSENLKGPIGLIAGGGRFPFLVQEETDPVIEDREETVHWVGLGELGRCVRAFKQGGVSQAIMAGKVKHRQIFRSLRPDWLVLKVLTRLKTRNTDAILGAVADVLEEQGIHLMDSTVFLAPLIAAEGTLSKRSPDREEKENIDFGFRMAKELARLDIGQTVVVKAKAVVAVEAMEGTDETIRRAGRIVSSSPGGLTVVKVARPGQDMRFDVPVVGPGTIDTMVDTGASALALEAGKTLLLEREEVLHHADEAGIAVYGERAQQS